MSDPATRLATYGTLAPGQPNHHQLAGLRGDWRRGAVRGHLLDEGWGAALGFPGLRLDAGADEIAVQVFTSPDLPQHWARLDAFEGEGYRRVSAEVAVDGQRLTAQIYVVAPAGQPD